MWRPVENMCASCNLCEDIEHQIIIINSLCIAIATVLAVIDNHAYITTHTYRCMCCFNREYTIKSAVEIRCSDLHSSWYSIERLLPIACATSSVCQSIVNLRVCTYHEAHQQVGSSYIFIHGPNTEFTDCWYSAQIYLTISLKAIGYDWRAG